MRERSHQPRSRQRPRVFAGVLSGAVAAAVLAIALLLPSGTPGSPSVSQAALLAGRGPALAAPMPDPSAPMSRLTQTVGALHFPNWQRLGWSASGRRIDRLDGRIAVTVFYRHAGQSIAYTILASPPLRWPETAAFTAHAIRFESLSVASRMVLTWRRDGHTCVLSGRRASVDTLTTLAAYDPRGALTSSDLALAQTY